MVKKYQEFKNVVFCKPKNSKNQILNKYYLVKGKNEGYKQWLKITLYMLHNL